MSEVKAILLLQLGVCVLRVFVWVVWLFLTATTFGMSWDVSQLSRGVLAVGASICACGWLLVCLFFTVCFVVVRLFLTAMAFGISWNMSQLGRGVIAFDRCVCVYVGGFVGAVCG